MEKYNIWKFSLRGYKRYWFLLFKFYLTSIEIGQKAQERKWKIINPTFSHLTARISSFMKKSMTTMIFLRIRSSLLTKCRILTVCSSSGEDTSILPGLIFWRNKERSGSKFRKILFSFTKNLLKCTTSLTVQKLWLDFGMNWRMFLDGTRPSHQF